MPANSTAILPRAWSAGVVTFDSPADFFEFLFGPEPQDAHVRAYRRNLRFLELRARTARSLEACELIALELILRTRVRREMRGAADAAIEAAVSERLAFITARGAVSSTLEQFRREGEAWTADWKARLAEISRVQAEEARR